MQKPNVVALARNRFSCPGWGYVPNIGLGAQIGRNVRIANKRKCSHSEQYYGTEDMVQIPQNGFWEFCLYNVKNFRGLMRCAGNIQRFTDWHDSCADLKNGENAMAYQIIRVTDQEVICEKETDAEAFRAASDLSESTGIKHFARKAPDWNWMSREQSRFRDGTYQPVIWAEENWFYNRADELKDHFLHRSSEKPEMIAFTESAEKGAFDRQTRMRAGAYLTKFFSDVLSEQEIMKWARLHALANDPDEIPEMKIARTRSEIREVYLQGPESCMSLEAGRYNSRPAHPVEVYGDSDLAVAYVERTAAYHGEPIASRCLIWPEQKVYGRIYPTPERYHSGEARESAKIEQTALARALSAAGYKSGSFDGAKIKAIKMERYSCDSEYVMPFLDGSYLVDLMADGDHFMLSRSEGVPAQNTHGTIDLSEGGMICDRCEDQMDEDDAHEVIIDRRHNTASYCDYCATEHAFYCEGYENRISDQACDSIEVGRYTYSLWYAEDHCVICEHTDEWVEMDDAVEVWVDEYHTEMWSRDAAEDDAFKCAISQLWYANDGQESVEINGETYLRSTALKVDELAAKIAEMESESEGAE